MRYALVDNATLTAVQRLLGDIPIYNKHAIDGDILAFETLIQAILFFDEVYYINDYKEDFKEERSHYFDYLGQLNIDGNSYEALLRETRKYINDVVPHIEGGIFTDSNFKPYFEILRMHNVFTWDMSSSVYYLTQKMLVNSKTDIDIEKYSKLNEMIFSEKNDGFSKHWNDKYILVDSNKNPITEKNIVVDKEGHSREAYIGSQTKLLLANLSWLAFRTIFYTLAAHENGGTLILHPIRNAFQINFLSRFFPKSNEQYRTLISALNAPVEETVKAIFAPTQPLITKFQLPMFSVLLTEKAGSPKEAISLAFEMKKEHDFVNARRGLSDIEQLFADENSQEAIKKANKLVLHVRILLERINAKYNVITPQGISLSPIILGYNMATLASSGVLPAIPNYSAKIKLLDKVKDFIPQRGFNAVYKSLINDLTQIGRLGEYHEMLTKHVVFHKNAGYYTSKEEKEQFIRAKSYWKIPV